MVKSGYRDERKRREEKGERDKKKTYSEVIPIDEAGAGNFAQICLTEKTEKMTTIYRNKSPAEQYRSQRCNK